MNIEQIQCPKCNGTGAIVVDTAKQGELRSILNKLFLGAREQCPKGTFFYKQGHLVTDAFDQILALLKRKVE